MAGRCIFNLNVLNSRGHTALHYAIEKQDHELLLILLRDPYIDLFQVDEDRVCMPRRLTVIFSAFHKILYHREKLRAKALFCKQLVSVHSQ